MIHHGEVQALDTKAALLARDTTRSLCLTLDDAAADLPETVVPFVAHRDGDQVHLRFNKDEHSPMELLNRLQEAGVVVADLQTRSPTLEDIFLELTGEAISEVPEEMAG